MGIKIRKAKTGKGREGSWGRNLATNIVAMAITFVDGIRGQLGRCVYCAVNLCLWSNNKRKYEEKRRGGGETDGMAGNWHFWGHKIELAHWMGSSGGRRRKKKVGWPAGDIPNSDAKLDRQ